MKSRLIEGAIIVLVICTASSLAAEPPRRPVISGMGSMGGGMGSMGGAIPSESSRLDGPTEGRRPLAELLRGLKSKDLTTRRKAALGLYWKSPPRDPAAIPPLIEALRDENAEIRGNIARALGSYGPQAKAAVPALLETVKNIGDAARFDAVSAIGEIGPEARGAVPVLIEMLAEKHYLAREAAAEALGRIGREARPAIKRLRKAMGDYAPPVRVAAASALWRITGSATESVPVLVSVLSNANAPSAADLSILEISQENGIPLTPFVRKDSQASPDTWMGSRPRAALTLGEMGHKARAAVPSLRKVAKDELGWIQFAAASALVSIDPKSVEIIPALRAALRERRPLLPLKSVECLGRLASKENEEAVLLLAEAMNDKRDLIRWIAADTLGKLGPRAKKALPQLFKALQSEDLILSKRAAQALPNINSHAKGILPSLTALLTDRNAVKRTIAANVLASIGLEAKAAVPVLVKALRDPDRNVRISAENAIRKIDPSAMPKKPGHCSPRP